MPACERRFDRGPARAAGPASSGSGRRGAHAPREFPRGSAGASAWGSAGMARHGIGSPAISGLPHCKIPFVGPRFSPPSASAYWRKRRSRREERRGSGEWSAACTAGIGPGPRFISWSRDVAARSARRTTSVRQRRLRRNPQPRPRKGLDRRARLCDQPRAPSRRFIAARRSSRMSHGAELALKWNATRRAEAPARGAGFHVGEGSRSRLGNGDPSPFRGMRRAPWRRSSTTSCRPSAARRSCGSTRSAATCRARSC